jgi:hypothetical protein
MICARNTVCDFHNKLSKGDAPGAPGLAEARV